MIYSKEEDHDKLKRFSSAPIQNKVLTINSEHPYSEDHFENKFQDNISSSDQGFEQPEEELIDFKGEQRMGTNKFSSEHIEIKWSLSLLKLYLLNNYLRLNSRPSFINLIKCLNNQNKN